MTDAGQVRLDVAFKGARTYLHGTDLFDAMMALAARRRGSALSNIRMSFYRPLTRGVAAQRLVAAEAAAPRPAALFEARVDGASAAWALVESGEPPTGRRPYDESRVTAGAVVDGRSIVQDEPTAFSFIERLVALNKRLLDTLHAEPKPSWWFARLEMPESPPASAALRLELEAGIGARLVKSSIEIDGRKGGAIYFSGKKA